MHVVGYLLFLGASVGNVNVLVFVLNYLYGSPLPRAQARRPGTTGR